MAMKLGSETGSAVNHVIAGAMTAPTPGGPATILGWTDRYAATVERVSPSGKTAWVREDAARLVEGSVLSEAQRYEYERNPSGRLRVFRLGKRGWRETGRGAGVAFGHRESYRDPSF